MFCGLSRLDVGSRSGLVLGDGGAMALGGGHGDMVVPRGEATQSSSEVETVWEMLWLTKPDGHLSCWAVCTPAVSPG